MLEFIFAFLLLLAASIYDVRERRIPNALILIALIAAFSYHYASGNLIPSLSSFLLAAVVSFILLLLGIFAGGDLKLLAALGALSPISAIGIPLAMLTLAISFLLSGIFLLLLAFIRNPEYLQKLFLALVSSLKKLPLIFLLALAVSLVFAPPSLNAALWLLALSFILVFSAHAVPLLAELASKATRHRKKISELEQGDVPAYGIRIIRGKAEKVAGATELVSSLFSKPGIFYVRALKETAAKLSEKKEKIIGWSADGLVKNDIIRLKALARKGIIEKEIELKGTVPMAPLLLVGYLVSLLLAFY